MIDGERGNRPHILSQEELLNQAVSILVPFKINEQLADKNNFMRMLLKVVFIGSPKLNQICPPTFAKCLLHGGNYKYLPILLDLRREANITAIYSGRYESLCLLESAICLFISRHGCSKRCVITIWVKTAFSHFRFSNIHVYVIHVLF